MMFTRYDRHESNNSIYCYDGTDILINKLEIKDRDLLEEAESEYSAQRLLELEAQPISGRFTLNHLKNIHRHIFQDIYPFAGKIRVEDISKGNTMFARSQNIKSYVSDILLKLKNENYIKALQQIKFCERIAYYMAELNIIHPFREGNGRTIREFIRCLGIECGYLINWSNVDKDVILNASILSVNNLTNLVACINECIDNN